MAEGATEGGLTHFGRSWVRAAGGQDGVLVVNSRLCEALDIACRTRQIIFHCTHQG
jgi:hypothetical protein